MTDPKPYNQRDYFPIRRRSTFGSQVNAVCLNYILRTGDIRTLESPPERYPNQTLNIVETEFGCSIENIYSIALDDLKDRPDVQSLLSMRDWDKRSREKWEQILAEKVSELVNEVDGFSKYRSSSQEGNEHLIRVTDMDCISEEVYKRDGYAYEFHCENFSAVEGAVIQMLENELLKPYSNNLDNSWKQPMQYFLAAGGTSFYADDEVGGHAFIVTPAGNIIEATHDPDDHFGSPYERTINDFSIEKLARGENALTESNSVYGDYYSGHDVTRNMGVPDQPEDLFMSRDQSVGANIVEHDDGIYHVNMYERMDIGTPHERMAHIYTEHLTKDELEYAVDNEYKPTCLEGGKDEQSYRISIDSSWWNSSYSIEKIEAINLNKDVQWKKISAADTKELLPQEQKVNAFNDNSEAIVARDVQDLSANKDLTSHLIHTPHAVT